MLSHASNTRSSKQNIRLQAEFAAFEIKTNSLSAAVVSGTDFLSTTAGVAEEHWERKGGDGPHKKVKYFQQRGHELPPFYT